MAETEGLPPSCDIEQSVFGRAGLAGSTSDSAGPSDPVPDDQVALLLLLSQRERERSRLLTTPWEEAAVRAKVA